MKLGKKGEEIARKFLKKKGYKLLAENYKTPMGEIDIIAKDGKEIVFIEVKTRESLQFGQPFEAVNYIKRKRITKAALSYLKRFKELPPCRFDVLSISYLCKASFGHDASHKDNKPHIDLIRDAFESSVEL